MAEPNTVLVSGATRRLLGEAFVCEDLGPRTLKGVPAPVAIHRVVRERDSLEPPEGRLSPLVGRERELGMLVGWEQCKEGQSRFVLLTGEAGIGKSRLVLELRAHVALESHIRLEGRGSPYHQQSAFHAWSDVLERSFGVDRKDEPAVRQAKVAGSARSIRPSTARPIRRPPRISAAGSSCCGRCRRPSSAKSGSSNC